MCVGKTIGLMILSSVTSCVSLLCGRRKSQLSVGHDGNVLEEKLIIFGEKCSLDGGVGKGRLHPAHTLLCLFTVHKDTGMNVSHIIKEC